ncbi:MAG: tetratricopeptide repeat protein, partial [Myxococcota bacterium]
MRWFTALGTLWLAAGLLGLAAGQLGCAALGATSEQNARKATSRLEVGSDHLTNGRSALALREFLAAEQFDPKNARVQYALADAYLARGKRAEAQLHVRRALEIFPDYHDARLFLSALLLMNKRYAEAIPECERLIDDPTFPSPWRALTNRAWAEYKLGRAKDARESLDLARDYQRDYWPATLALAIVEGDAGRRSEAIRLYQDIIAQNPGPAVESEVNYRIAEIYVSLGKRREAMGHLTTSVARSPES